ncbi:hypothetical protein ACXYMU_00990 [Pontibacter sp. CAU 1760]
MMLAYVKIILQKVIFDAVLFEKELRKGLRALNQTEALQLKTWCYDAFYRQHPLVLASVFAGVPVYRLRITR